MKTKNEKTLTISKMIALFGAVLMLVCIFLPYATAIDDHAQALKENPDKVVYAEMDITAGDMVNVSMVQYANLYSKLSEQIFGSSAAGILYVVFVGLVGGFALIAALFALGKKPIAVTIFTLLSYGVFNIHSWDFTDRGVVPSTNYGWGIGYYLYFVAVAITVVGAIWLLVAKIKSKKAAKDEVQG